MTNKNNTGKTTFDCTMETIKASIQRSHTHNSEPFCFLDLAEC